jgi:WD40 repeat protein
LNIFHRFYFVLLVAISYDTGLINVYNESSLSLVKSFKAHSSCPPTILDLNRGSCLRIKQSPFTNEYVATASFDRTAKIWNSSNWTLIRTYTNHTSFINDAEFIDADTVATGSKDLTIKLWSISTGLTNRTITTGSIVFSLKVLINGCHLAAACDSLIYIYNINTGILIATLSGHTYTIYNLELISQNYGDDLLASSSDDTSVRIWNLTTNTCKFILNGHTHCVYGLKQISTDILASGSWDTMIMLWNITTGALIRTLSGHTDWIYWSVDLLSDGQTLVSGSWDQTVKFWNISTGELLNTINTDSSLISFAITGSAKRSKFIFKILLDVI